jgi:hypothetical protein
MMMELHKNGLGAPTSSLDPLLAVLVQVKTCSALLRLALEIQTHEIHSQGPCSVTASESVYSAIYSLWPTSGGHGCCIARCCVAL